MTKRKSRSTVTRGFALALIGLFLAIGCAATEAGQPTLALLNALPTHRPEAPFPIKTSTPAATAASLPTSVHRVTLVPSPTVLASDTPAPTSAPPSPEPQRWLLAYDSDIEGDDEIYLLPADGGPPVNITHHPAEDRYPAWSPDGNRIAFQSNRDGNWEIYVLELEDHRSRRLTFDRAYDGTPGWSPDGRWIVFESYRDKAPCEADAGTPNPPMCPDLEIYRIQTDGGRLQRLTDSVGGDYQPVWSPDDKWIAFTSWRNGDKDIFVIPTDGGLARNVTASPGDDWSPAWSPDGDALVFLSDRAGVIEIYQQFLDNSQALKLASNEFPKERPTWWSDGNLLFAQYDPGPSFEAYDPYRPGEYHLYSFGPAGSATEPLLPAVKARNPATAPLAQLTSVTPSSVTAKVLPQPFPLSVPPRLELVHLNDVVAPDPRLVAGVDEAFRAWRNAVHQSSGHDFLGRLSDVFRPAAYYSHRLGYLSWHKAGRAVDLLFDWRDAQGKNALYIVREDLAGEVYWRLYLKCAVQDGTMGEPLTQAPWYFWWHPDPANDPETLANGGRRLPIPPGYFVDVTALAERYGWSRIASYRLDDFHWQRDSTATEYWHYQHVDGMDWYQAMSQIYAPELMDELFSRSMAAARGQTEEVMEGKGLPPAQAPSGDQPGLDTD